MKDGYFESWADIIEYDAGRLTLKVCTESTTSYESVAFDEIGWTSRARSLRENNKPNNFLYMCVDFDLTEQPTFSTTASVLKFIGGKLVAVNDGLVYNSNVQAEDIIFCCGTRKHSHRTIGYIPLSNGHPNSDITDQKYLIQKDVEANLFVELIKIFADADF
jgi:hypothetical protein